MRCNAPRLTCNLCWSGESSLDAVLDEYACNFERLRHAGISVVRIWCPPWLAESDQPSSAEGPGAQLHWRAVYFGRLLDIAAKKNVELIICLFSHVEFLDRDWHKEVKNRAYTWRGNPFDAANDGPCAKPAAFFGTPDARRIVREWFVLLGAQLSGHPALFAWDVFNEPDRIEDFSASAFCDWLTDVAAGLKTGGPVRITVGLADALRHAVIWKHADIDLIQYHTHGWPHHEPLENILSLQRALRALHKPAFCGEFGWDSQICFTDIESERIADVVACSIVVGGALAAMPWWWEAVLSDSCLLARLQALAEFLEDGQIVVEREVEQDSDPNRMAGAITLAAAAGNLARKGWRRKFRFGGADLFKSLRALARALRQPAAATHVIVGTGPAGMLAYIKLPPPNDLAARLGLSESERYTVRVLDLSSRETGVFHVSNMADRRMFPPNSRSVLLHIRRWSPWTEATD